MAGDSATAIDQNQFDWKKFMFLMIGVALFTVTYYSPLWPDAVDPAGKHFALTKEGKGAIAVFLLAGTWWVFEVVPIGITSLAIGLPFRIVPTVRSRYRPVPRVVIPRSHCTRVTKFRQGDRASQAGCSWVGCPSITLRQRVSPLVNLVYNDWGSRGRGKPCRLLWTPTHWISSATV